MTFDDDFILIHFKAVGPRRLLCKSAGIDWPPPEKITELGGQNFEDDPLVRVSMSRISDEDRAAMPCVMRGAEYFYQSDIKPAASVTH